MTLKIEKMKIEDIVRKIDYALLHKQKIILINMIQDWGEADDEQQRIDAAEAEGLVNLIEALQDHAVDELRIDEVVVFNMNES